MENRNITPNEFDYSDFLSHMNERKMNKMRMGEKEVKQIEHEIGKEFIYIIYFDEIIGGHICIFYSEALDKVQEYANKRNYTEKQKDEWDFQPESVYFNAYITLIVDNLLTKQNEKTNK